MIQTPPVALLIKTSLRRRAETWKCCTTLCSQQITISNVQNKYKLKSSKWPLNAPPPNLSMCVSSSHFSRRLARGHASKGHTGGRSRKIVQPAEGAVVLLQEGYNRFFARRSSSRILCTNELIVLHSRLRPIQVALMVVNKFTNDKSRVST